MEIIREVETARENFRGLEGRRGDMELFRHIDDRITNGLTELFLKSLSRLKNKVLILFL